ncbi:MAG: pentapeptide repeat-containing protein [Pseudomonadota bacterium]
MWRFLIRAAGWGAALLTLGFALMQVYIDRRIAAIEANGLLLQMASDPQTTDYGVRWALSEIAACQPWGGLVYSPAGPDGAALSASAFVARHNQNWESCRDEARDLRGVDAGDFGFEDIVFCPDSTAKLLGALSESAFIKSRRKGVSIRGSDLSCVRLDDANMAEAEIEDSRFIGASFEFAQLDGSRWVGADLRWARFDHAVLTGAVFSGQALRLAGASFEQAQLAGAVFDDAVDLSGVVFRRADLSGADLTQSRGLRRAGLAAACVREGRQPDLPEPLSALTLGACAWSPAPRPEAGAL